MVTMQFKFARCPRIEFGAGAFEDLAGIVAGFGGKTLLVTGSSSLESSGRLVELTDALGREPIDFARLVVRGEPSPDFVDNAVALYRGGGIAVVVAVGGGSVIDAGKAVSAMLLEGGSVTDYLEGVGDPSLHSGLKVPFVAVPTTAGTGSEATKNAVLSRVGPGGFKRSLRHDNFVPEVALVDPELMTTCPSYISAACGMDALTQLLESYVSTGSSPITDSLAESGLAHVRDNLTPACGYGSNDVEVRAGMAYAALLSGITLSNAGLGVVHGLAAAIGGLFEIPHGVICGTLVGASTRATIRALEDTEDGSPHLAKYARAGSLLTGIEAGGVELDCELLLRKLDDLTERLDLPTLGWYGVTESDIERIVELTENKSNPAQLDAEAVRGVLLARLQRGVTS